MSVCFVRTGLRPTTTKYATKIPARSAIHGAGVYVFNQNNPAIHTENGFEVPNTPGVKLHHIMTVNLSAGIIDHVVNGVGNPADTTMIGVPIYLANYPAA